MIRDRLRYYYLARTINTGTVTVQCLSNRNSTLACLLHTWVPLLCGCVHSGLRPCRIPLLGSALSMARVTATKNQPSAGPVTGHCLVPGRRRPGVGCSGSGLGVLSFVGAPPPCLPLVTLPPSRSSIRHGSHLILRVLRRPWRSYCIDHTVLCIHDWQQVGSSRRLLPTPRAQRRVHPPRFSVFLRAGHDPVHIDIYTYPVLMAVSESPTHR